MESKQTWNFIGRLERDCRFREYINKRTKSEMIMFTFNVAINDRHKNEDGSWGDEAVWVEVRYFTYNDQRSIKRVDVLKAGLKKGKWVAIEGKARMESYRDNEGKLSHKLICLAHYVSVFIEHDNEQEKQDG